jgi:DNA-binding NtrC family response regulator
MTSSPGIPKNPDRNILVVDDDPTVRRLLEKLLSELYTVHVAHSPEAAETILKEHPVDVILCDHFMQEELGLDFIIRISPDYPQTVKVMLTGCFEVETVMDAINAGHVFRYLSKPFTRKTILRTLEDALEECDSRRSLEQITEQHREMSEQLYTWDHRFERFKTNSTRFVRQAFKFLALTLGIIAGFFLIVTVIGVAALLFLYAVKSFLGFDTFEYFHLDNILEKFLQK